MAAWEWDWHDTAVVAFCAWCGLSLAWSPDWRQGLVDLQLVASLGACYLAVRRIGVPVWGVILAALCAVNPWLPFGGAFNENTQAEFLLVCLPLLIGWKGNTGLVAYGTAAVVLVALVGSSSHIPLAALAVSLGAFVLWKSRHRLPVFLLALSGVASVAAIGVTLAVVYVPDLHWSILARLHLYAGTLAMWAHAPVWGNGLGSFDYLFPGFQNADRAMFPGLEFLNANDAAVFPGTAANDFLQLLAETGLIGFGLFVALVVIGFRWEWRAGLALAVLGLAMSLDSPLHDPETAFLGAAALGFAHPKAPKPFQVPVFTKIFAFPVLILAVVGVQFAVLHVRAEKTYGMALAIHRENPQFAFAGVLSAENSFPYDKRYRLQLFRSLAEGMFTGKIKSDWQTVDNVYKTSSTAIPEGAGLLISRLYLLVAGGRCADECASIRETLARNDPRLIEVQAINAGP